MADSTIHVYIEPDLLRDLTNNNFSNDNVFSAQSIDTIEVSGINIKKHSFKVKFIGVKTFRQLGMCEVDCRAQLSIMVYPVRKQRDGGTRVMTVTNGKKDFLNVTTLRNLCFAIPGLIKRHAVLRNLTDKDCFYRMLARPRGMCVIINNRSFQDTNGNQHINSMRHGSDIDVHNLKSVFREFNMNVQIYSDLTDCDIILEAKKISLLDHSSYDMFVCCILSHGRNGSVLGINNIEVPILEVTSTFRNRGCPTLGGKPKLFFIQACQGVRPQRGVVQTDVRAEEESCKVLPDGSDFLVACSTEPGYESFRHSQKGSYFVNSLVNQLKASSNRSVVEVLTDVCNDVSNETFYNCYKQVPWFTSTLTKTLVLNQNAHYVNTG